MSMHKIPLTPLEETGLITYGLPINKPSQLSDAFRQGMLWGALHKQQIIEQLQAQVKSLSQK